VFEVPPEFDFKLTDADAASMKTAMLSETHVAGLHTQVFAFLVCQKRGRRLPEQARTGAATIEKASPPRTRGEASGQSGRELNNATGQAAPFKLP
jgi:hypothetical protein